MQTYDEVAKADEILSQQKRKYEDEVAKADEILSQQKDSLKNNAVRKIAGIQQEVLRYKYEADQVNVILDVVNINAEKFIKNQATAERRHSEIPFNRALDSVNENSDVPYIGGYLKVIGILIIPSAMAGAGLFDSPLMGIVISIIISALIYFTKRGSVATNLQQLNSAAVAQCNLIGQEMQSALAKVPVERDKQAADVRSRKDRAIAERDKQAADVRSRKDRAIAYIKREYQSFNKRLCSCLDEFQSLLDTWTAENADVTSILSENRVQNCTYNSDQISPCLTRVGTFGFLNKKFPQASSDFAESESPPVLNDPSGAEGNHISPDTVEQEDAEVLFVRGLNEQGVLMKPDKSADLDLHLKELFSGWVISGDHDTSTLSAFDNILRITGYEDPRQTMQTWVEFARKRVSDVLAVPTSELEYLDINLSIELDQLDVETSFFLLYELSNKQGDPPRIARVRLALIALVGEKTQQQLIGEFNKRIS